MTGVEYVVCLEKDTSSQTQHLQYLNKVRIRLHSLCRDSSGIGTSSPVPVFQWYINCYQKIIWALIVQPNMSITLISLSPQSHDSKQSSSAFPGKFPHYPWNHSLSTHYVNWRESNEYKNRFTSRISL